MTNEEMVEQFQCSGCVAGPNPATCSSYKPEKNYGFRCAGHVLGTMIFPGVGNIALGLPKGFCRPGWEFIPQRASNQMLIRLWTAGTSPSWDKFNLATWAMEKDGFLFVRTYSPRINQLAVDVVEGGKLDLCPGAVNVGEFYDQID